MKILIISPFENSATGRGDRNILLERELVERGHDVSYITSDFDHARKCHISRDMLKEREGLKVIHIPGYKSNVSLSRIISNLSFAIKCWFWAVSKRWDLVFVSTIPPEILLAAVALNKKRLVADIRDIWPDALLAYGKPSALSKAFGHYCNLIYTFALKRADRILIVATGYRKWLARYHALRHWRVKFVPLGFRRDDFQPLSKEGGSFAFCYAGGATPQFDIREFSDEYADKMGIVLGSGPMLGAWKKSFPAAEFRGTVPRETAMRIMSESRLLLLPSNPFAQLPNKAFDYFALGYPVTMGKNCSRDTRYLLNLRNRHSTKIHDGWQAYSSLEKQSLVTRAADIIEETVR